MAANRFTQLAELELTENANAKARLTRLAGLALVENTAANVRIPQLAFLVLTDPPSTVPPPLAFCQVIG